MDLVELPAEVERHPVREMPAVRQVHPEDPVTGLEHAEVGRHVGLGPAVRLDVDVLGAREEGERPFLGEPLGDIDVLAAAVVPLARQALGVLVGQPAALRLHHRGGDVVLARDQLDLLVLPTTLGQHRLPQDGVDLGDRLGREVSRTGDGHGRPTPSCPGRATLAGPVTGPARFPAIFPRPPP